MTQPAVKRFLREYPEALSEANGAIFVGAGMSMAAGYPSWSALLRDIGDELGIASTDVHDLAALAQWSIQESGGATRVRNVIKKEIGIDYPIPEALQVIARLPIRNVWTTNYDRLIERAFKEISRPVDVISGAKDLALKAVPGATRIYKMHGSVDRLEDVVISTDDYELYRSRRGAFLPLLQAHLTSMSMLFVGLSFTDPNVKHVLSLIRESFTDAPPEHFAIVRPPQREDCASDDEFRARKTQHDLWAKDLKRYGLSAVEIEDYKEVPDLLRQVERRVASRRVWISGSWPVETGGDAGSKIYSLAEELGMRIGKEGLSLVTGTGLVVGAAAVSGFLRSQREGGGWDLDRRLVARPFPQPAGKINSHSAQWTALRRELARQAGTAIFIGGAKLKNEVLVSAPGVQEEFSIAKEMGVFLLPVGASGGSAKEIYSALVGSDLPTTGPRAVRPTDDELHALADESLNQDVLMELVFRILGRVIKPE